LPIARTPNQSVASSVNVLEFIPLEEESFNRVDSLIDSDYLVQEDDYWNGFWIDIWSHAINNNLVRREVDDYIKGEHKVVFDEPLAQKIWKGTLPDAYSFTNHPHTLDTPGEYLHSMEPEDVGGVQKYKLYLWPKDPGNLDNGIAFSQLGYAFGCFNQANCSFTTIEGFEISNYNRNGILIHEQSGGEVDSVHIRNNTVFDIAGTGIYFIHSKNSLAEYNTVYNTMNSGRGIFMNGGSNGTIQKNKVHDTDSTAISFYVMDHGKILENEIGTSIGVHGNGISTYIDSINILVADNYFYGGATYTLNSTANIIVYNNLFDARDKATTILVHWSGTYSKGLAAVVNNVIIGSSSNNGFSIGSSDSYPNGGPQNLENITIVKNNIIDGYNNFDGTIHTHNLYTDYGWMQSDKYNWVLGEGEVDATGLELTELFNDYDNFDLRLKPGSIAVDSGENSAEMDVLIARFNEIFPEYDFYKDMKGNPRPSGQGWDIGPFELQGDDPGPQCINTMVLLNYISKWKQGSLELMELLEKIAMWKAGTGCP